MTDIWTQVREARDLLRSVPDGDLIDHSEAVADRVSAGEARAVAYLHDLVEDGMITPDQMEPFSFGIQAAVFLLTRVKGMTYASYISRLVRAGDALAIEVKVADLKCNLARSKPGSSLIPRYTKALASLQDVA